MVKAFAAGSFGAFSDANKRRPRAKRVSRAMVDLLEPRRLLAPWITTEVAGEVVAGALDVEVADGRAYVWASDGKLMVLDVSGPGIPVQLARLDTEGKGVAAASGSYLYLYKSNALTILDVSNPAAPTTVGSYTNGSAFTGMRFVGSSLYFTDADGLKILDISNPASLTLTGSLGISGIGTKAGVAVAGSYAYVNGPELTVVSIADPAHPVAVGSCHPQIAQSGVEVVGSAAYAIGGSTIDIIDVSNPAAPVDGAVWHLTGTALDWEVNGSAMYVIEGNQVDVFDVSAPLSLNLRSMIPTWALARGVDVWDSKMYVAEQGALLIYNVANPLAPGKIGEWAPPAPTRVAFSGSIAYVNEGEHKSGLHIMDIHNFDAPTWVGRRGAGVINDIVVSGSYLYLTEGGGVEVFDISTPSNPVRVGLSSAPDGLNGMTISGSYAYVAAKPATGGGGCLDVFSLANPAAPTLVGRFASTIAASDVAVSGTIAYLAAADHSLRIIDVFDPANMVELGSVRFPFTVDVDHVLVGGSHVYIGGNDGSYIVDVSNPVTPVVVDSSIQWPILALSGNLAFTTTEIFDVSDPAAVRHVGENTRGPDSMALYGDSRALVANGSFETIRFNIGENEPATDINLSQTNFAENSPVGTVIGTLGSTCLNPSNTFTYGLIPATGPTDNRFFTISGNQLKTNSQFFNYESKSSDAKHSYSIRIRSTDAVGQWFEKAFTINMTDVNEWPTDLIISAGSIAENQPVGTPVGTFLSNDPDAGSTFTYSLVSGTGSDGNGSFTIDGNTLRSAANFNAASKSSYSIRVRTTDQGGLWYENAFTISVSSGNGTPTDITLSPASIAENQPLHSVVGTLSSSDPNAGDSFTYSLAWGFDSSGYYDFAISGNQLLVGPSLNCEARNSYSVRIRTTDQGGLWLEKTLMVSVTNVNETPTGIALSNQAVAEKQPVGTVVGTFLSTDVDAGDSFSYTLEAGAGSTDNGSFTVNGSQLLTAASFIYGARNFYSIRVRTTDQGGLFYEKALWVEVTANQAPTDISLSASSIAENQPMGTAVGAFSTTAPNGGGTFTYTLVAGSGSEDNASFMISGSELLAAGPFDYEAKSSYSIRVRSTDQGGLFHEKSFTISVTDVDEMAPTVTAVYVRGSNWAAGYLAFLAGNLAGSSSTYGYAIPVGSGALQLQTLPWRTLNQISVRFSEDVSVTQAQFAIVGSVGSYSISGFSYNSTDHVATWSLSAYMGPDKLYVAVPSSGSSPVRDAAGNALDGEWSNPSSFGQVGSTDTFPSGNGSAGGDFAFRFDVLPGDSTGGSLGKVNVADVAQTKSRSNLPVSSSTYRSDFDGNNLVNVADVAYVKSRSTVYSLPVNPPVVPVFGAVSSQVSLLVKKDRSLTLW